MQNTGKFIAVVSVSGRAMDSNGVIISRDTHDLPPIWLQVIAGTIPNRQTLSGSIAQRMGIPMDSNGVIASNAKQGNSYSKRIIFGSWLQSAEHDAFGPQFTWTMIKDMTEASVIELEQACDYLGKPDVFTVDKPELPSDYQRKTNQHIGKSKLDPLSHSLTNPTMSNPVEQAIEQVGYKRSDSATNPEVVVENDLFPNKENHGNTIAPKA